MNFKFNVCEEHARSIHDVLSAVGTHEPPSYPDARESMRVPLRVCIVLPDGITSLSDTGLVVTAQHNAYRCCYGYGCMSRSTKFIALELRAYLCVTASSLKQVQTPTKLLGDSAQMHEDDLAWVKALQHLTLEVKASEALPRNPQPLSNETMARCDATITQMFPMLGQYPWSTSYVLTFVTPTGQQLLVLVDHILNLTQASVQENQRHSLDGEGEGVEEEESEER